MTVFDAKPAARRSSKAGRKKNVKQSLEGALVGDARIDGKRFRRKAPILTLIEAAKRSGGNKSSQT